MTCQDARLWMQDSLDGTLSPDQRLSLESHLDGCEACRQDDMSLREAVRKLEALPRVTAPPELMLRLGPRLDQLSQRKRARRWAPVGMVAAGLLLALGLTRMQPAGAPQAPEQFAMEPLTAEEILEWVDASADPDETLPL